MSFLEDAVYAANSGFYELRDFLRTRCRAADSDIVVAVGEGVQEVEVQFIEGLPCETDESLWRLLANATTGVVRFNCDRGDVTITVEFDL